MNCNNINEFFTKFSSFQEIKIFKFSLIIKRFFSKLKNNLYNYIYIY